MTGLILEKNHMLAIMVRKFQERNPFKGKALDFEMILQDRIQTDHNDHKNNEKFVYLLAIKF